MSGLGLHSLGNVAVAYVGNTGRGTLAVATALLLTLITTADLDHGWDVIEVGGGDQCPERDAWTIGGTHRRRIARPGLRFSVVTNIDDVPGLSGPLRRALHQAGFHTLAELDGQPRTALLNLHGVGKAGLDRLATAMAAEGHALAGSSRRSGHDG